MRKLTKFEIDTSDLDELITFMHLQGIGGEGNTKYQLFTIEVRRISFDCDKKFLGICNSSDGTQTGYAIILNTSGVVVESVYITECFESEVLTVLGAYAGSVYMHNTLSDIYIRDYTNIKL